MIRFENDYSRGCIPEILTKLPFANEGQRPGYGKDEECALARTIIQSKLEKDSDIHFLVGGTQTNVTVLSHLLSPWQGIITADSGHINTHETGAIEALGHKCIALESQLGKINAKQVSDCLEEYFSNSSPEHSVLPGAVYISFPTETGLLYSKKELEELHEVCQHHRIPFFIDGARLGYGLASTQCDLEFKDFGTICDVLYIGGTKIGALFGEVVVFNDLSLGNHFRFSMKQKGGLLAKGFLLGLQFQALFESDLYFTISKNAIEMATLITKDLKEKGYSFYYPSQTNQLFPIVSKELASKLSKQFGCGHWTFVGNQEVIRIVTDWGTKKEEVELLLSEIPNQH